MFSDKQAMIFQLRILCQLFLPFLSFHTFNLRRFSSGDVNFDMGGGVEI